MIFKIAWKNIWFKPLNTVLSIILLTASVAIISLLILLQKQFEKQFSSNIDGVDLVIGAKGSPMQLILSSVYQMDAPTGNINYKEAKVWMKHPYVKTAIPLAFGDNYRGFKILGTTADYLTKYDTKISSGVLFTKNFDVVLGSEVARKMNLKVGDTFFSSHGDAVEGEVHEEHPYVVKGIASSTGKVIDNLILSNIESVWAIHNHEEEAETVVATTHEHHEGDNHEHDENVVEYDNHEITAVLIKLKNKMGFVLWPRLISQNTDMQAASPAIEINRLFSLFGIGLDALQYLAYGIMLISGISIFIALYNTLKERKYEFALMRVSGASRSQLLILVLFESILLCFVGFVFGTIVGRLGLYFISTSTEQDYKMAFNPFEFAVKEEGILFLTTIFVGVIAALIPAVKAYRLNISKTLAHA
ncbi:FtsX-like permease family protein [Flavobacterium antarcticum]|uniref:ABC transporter permease n=1 Tax=Flavobacterium antarcticum TaxID=271155 RepID=UPI0003B3B9CB|nr:FtsX-like permease family protein [Flavobacterium antarcticum]